MGLLFFALFNSILGLSVLFPVMGPLGRSLSLSETEIGLVASGYALTQLLFAPLWGRLSETRGRKPILLVGIVGYAIGFAAFGIAASFGASGALSGAPLVAALLTARLVGGAMSSATLPTAQAIAADLSEEKDRTKAMGLVGAAFGLAVIFGPALGALTSHFAGLLAPVWLSVTLAILNALLVALRLPEPSRKRTKAEPPALLPIARKLPALLAVAFLTTLSSVAMEQTIAFAFQDRLSLTPEETPRWVGMGLVAYGLVVVLAQGYIVRRFNIAPRSLLLLGMPTALVGMAMLTFVSSFEMLVTALTIQGLGQGLILPGVTSGLSLAVSEDEQGAVAGLGSSAQGLARLAGPVVGARLYELGGALPFELASALLVVSFVVLVLSKASPRAAEPTPASEL